MIYELRVYTCMPGMLPALLRRFEDHTLRIWERHGIVQAGFWTVLVGENNHELLYLLRWESMADRETRWNAFQADPEWLERRKQSETGGPILRSVRNSFLQPTAFSAIR